MHDYYFLPFEFLFRSLNLDLGFVHAVAHLDPALVELLGQAVLEGLQLVKAIGHLKGTRRKKLMANYVPRKYSYTNTNFRFFQKCSFVFKLSSIEILLP